jgi:ABC-type multidrug transport system ATPase subunit
MSLFRVEGIAKVFGNFAALRNATADFYPGKMYIITGENGAGKSTLLRIIAGLLPATRGKVLRENVPQNAFGLMAHATMLYDELSGMENLRCFGALYGATEAQCEAAMRTVGLDPKLERAVGKYSQGMRQRLALARAIMHEPKLLLLDEPFSNLDVQSATAMVQVLSQLRDAGMCVLIVTHQVGLLTDAADMRMHIEAGIMREVPVRTRAEVLQ